MELELHVHVFVNQLFKSNIVIAIKHLYSATLISRTSIFTDKDTSQSLVGLIRRVALRYCGNRFQLGVAEQRRIFFYNDVNLE